jgi:hypothetical protein
MAGTEGMPADEWTVERHLEALPDSIVELYDAFIELVDACGPFEYRVTKTAIALKGVRRGFAGLKPKTRSLDGFLDLQRRIADDRFLRVSAFTKRLYVHQFRLTDPAQLDTAFRSWIREAYEVGAGAHL